MEKESIELQVMWHIDALIQPFPITLVTSIDGQGRINAAPYSLVVPFCSSPENPQMQLITSNMWHTAKNIEETGEFVLNYPSAHQIKEITEMARYYPEGINELNYTSFTTMPSKWVRPPKIVECYQHIECRVREIIQPSEYQLNFIADILDLSLNKGLYELPRAQKAKRVNTPILLGIGEHQNFVFGKIAEIESLGVPLNVEVEIV
jgi:flavin reductase (DIM6/NTAB) family NADH-FMN oxidoreductase RutF